MLKSSAVLSFLVLTVQVSPVLAQTAPSTSPVPPMAVSENYRQFYPNAVNGMERHAVVAPQPVPAQAAPAPQESRKIDIMQMNSF